MMTDKELRTLFDENDLNKDGSLEEEELIKSFEGITDTVNAELIREIFKSTDTNNDGSITFEEFVEAHQKQMILDRFVELDLDGDGYITRMELLESFKDIKNEKLIAMFKKADCDNDGFISFEGI